MLSRVQILSIAALLWAVVCAESRASGGSAGYYIIPDGVGMGNGFARAIDSTDEFTYFTAGRYWDGTKYRGLITSTNSEGQQNLAFGGAGGLPGKLAFDLAGAGLETSCMGIRVVHNDELIAVCRSLNASSYYETYLVKFDDTGALDTAFNGTGIMPTGLQTGTNSVLVRGIDYNSSIANGHNGEVAVVGAIGDYGSGTFHPYIATFDQQTGAAVHETTISALNGTAVGVVTDGTYYYVAITDMNAPYHFYVYRFNSSLTASGSPWGTAPNIAAGGGAGDDLPSSIALGGAGLIVGGSDRANTSAPWTCLIADIDISTGNLTTSAGHDSLAGAANFDNKGIFLFSHDTGNPVTKSCILNALEGVSNGFAGTAYNGANYDYLVGQMDYSGATGPTFISTQNGGSRDDVFYAIFPQYYGISVMAGREDGATYAQPSTASYAADGSILPTEDSDFWYGSFGGLPTAVRDAVAVSDGSDSYFIGGWDGSSTYSTDIRAYAPTFGMYSFTDTLPIGGIGMSAAIANGKILIFGGIYNGSPQNAGGIYDPSNGDFTAMTTTGAPSARYGHTGVWTGSKYLVWGGYDGSGALGDGAMYDPSNDTWTDMDFSISTPIERYNHSAVWTGSKMIIFGGYNTGLTSELNDVVAFDPNDGPNGSWSALSQTNGPSARQKHFAVWTGTYMLIYGGQASGAYASGTFGYDPVNDRWIQGTASNEPHYLNSSVVWTGNEILVWGGTVSGTRQNAGYAYTPATNSWTAISTTSVPAARDHHSAVWDGSGMTIFGGFDGTSNTNATDTYYPKGP